MIKLVAFDLDGTIVDTVPMSIEAFEKSISPYIDHPLDKNEIIQTFGLNEEGTIKAIVKDQWQNALVLFYKIYEELLTNCNPPFEGIISLIDYLKTKGIIVALITGKGERTCKITLSKLNMSNVFSDIMTGNEFKNGKKDALLELMKKYHLSTEECVYIGDAISDFTTANSAGVKCFSAAWTESADKEGLEKVNNGNVFESIALLKQTLTTLI